MVNFPTSMAQKSTLQINSFIMIWNKKALGAVEKQQKITFLVGLRYGNGWQVHMLPSFGDCIGMSIDRRMDE